jgi:hypothetical protein
MLGFADDANAASTDANRFMMIRPRFHTAIFAMVLAFTGFVALVPAHAERSVLTEKINAYIDCINRESARAYSSRERYFSWAAKTGPTGSERIIYGTYTIYDPKSCADGVAAANAKEPHEPELEALGTAYVDAIVKLEPLLKEADDYYEQQNYKDDHMAKGKAMHPRLIAAWDAFAVADKKLRAAIDVIQDKTALEKLAEVERTEGRKGHFYLEAVMLRAKALLRVEKVASPDIEKVNAALSDFDAVVTEADRYATENKESGLGSMFVSAAKEYLKTAKQAMRRVRDHVPYSQGEQMMLTSGAGWTVEGSPARLVRDYNSLVDSYNQGGRF